MRKSLLLFLLFYFTIILNAQIKIYYEGSGQIKYQADTINGMLNGDFKFWSLKGVKLLEGKFKDNQKYNKWTYYNNTGKPQITRNYENSYHFTEESKKTQNNFNVNRDKNGLIKYPFVDEKDIAVGGTIYSYIKPNSINKFLFQNNKLWNLIVKSIKNDTITEVYENGDFHPKLSNEKALKKIDKYPFDIVGYKAKTYWYFDNNLKTANTRLLGICPVVKNKEYGVESDLFWVFYADFRDALSEKTEFLKNQKYKTIDDALHFRHFSSYIYHEVTKPMRIEPLKTQTEGVYNYHFIFQFEDLLEKNININDKELLNSNYKRKFHYLYLEHLLLILQKHIVND